MASLGKLSALQSNKIIDDTQAELSRRENIDTAVAEMRSILKKYNIDFQDIDLNSIAEVGDKKRTKKRAKTKKSHDQRRTVKPKYKDPNSSSSWTGRGLTPAWVQRICQNGGIDIEEFKKDDRFCY